MQEPFQKPPCLTNVQPRPNISELYPMLGTAKFKIRSWVPIKYRDDISTHGHWIHFVKAPQKIGNINSATFSQDMGNSADIRKLYYLVFTSVRPPCRSTGPMPPVPTGKTCKECRRLRLACDREVPCHNCRRRGCSDICPDGTLQRGARPRSTIIVELQETIAELRNRNYLLEEALRKLQATTSSEPHPLLQERTPSEGTEGNTPSSRTPPSSEVNVNGISDALDKFFIVGDGEVSLHGPTASAEYLVKGNPALLSDLVQKMESPMSLPPDIILLSALFPFSPDAMPLERLDDFDGLLPPYQTTLTLSKLYVQNIVSCVNAVPYDSFIASVITECYPQGVQVTNLRHISPHILSILFMVCAMGSLANINNSSRFVEAEEYHTIARAVLCLRPVYVHPTLHATQSMCLMLLYHLITERRSTGYVMALWSVLARMCEMLKLNYDEQKLKKDSGELRKIVFWEIMYVDSWHSFVFGRDRSMKFNTITCKKPLDPDPTPGGGYETWKYRHASMLDNAVNRAFREKGSTYSLIQQLDHELRTIYCPHSIEWPEDAAERAAVLGLPPHDNANAMQRYLAKVARETALLHFHRWFFQQAIHDNPGNPFQHPFEFSVKATLDASRSIIRAKHDIYIFQRVNIITLRFMWLHTYSAAVSVIRTFISLFPMLDEAADALSTFDCACDMFISMEEHRVPSMEALHVLRNLHNEAHRAMISKTPSFSTDSLEKLGFWTNVPNPYS